MKVKVKSKVIPTNFLKIEGKRTFVGPKEGWLVELVGGRNPGPKAPPTSKRRGSKGDVKAGAIEKSRYVRIIEGDVIDDPINLILSPRGDQKCLLSPRGGDGS